MTVTETISHAFSRLWHLLDEPPATPVEQAFGEWLAAFISQHPEYVEEKRITPIILDQGPIYSLELAEDGHVQATPSVFMRFLGDISPTIHYRLTDDGMATYTGPQNASGPLSVPLTNHVIQATKDANPVIGGILSQLASEEMVRNIDRRALTGLSHDMDRF